MIIELMILTILAYIYTSCCTMNVWFQFTSV